METTAGAGANPNHFFIDFEPYCVWHRKEDSDVLEVHLQGFKKDQLRVQINNARILTISGQRQSGDNQWSRFRKQIKLADNSSESDVRSKFTGGILKVIMPKRAWSIPMPSDVLLQTGRPAQDVSVQPKPEETTTEAQKRSDDIDKGSSKGNAELRGMKLGSCAIGQRKSGGWRLKMMTRNMSVVVGLVVALSLAASIGFYVKCACRSQPLIWSDI
ncbi:hypothetical protein FNV43_RR21140 [Rhamnella rubrinervis]|uniref:SHSP domain-containing protein n=1 Tax=Rhamnella rubrinervis TaxID=2594499 RepID=A0A8K0E1Q7_9ROSA|nr:hypothetical protein FNV43_RR21140 [Rhamnella rubrinervis]